MKKIAFILLVFLSCIITGCHKFIEPNVQIGATTLSVGDTTVLEWSNVNAISRTRGCFTSITVSSPIVRVFVPTITSGRLYSHETKHTNTIKIKILFFILLYEFCLISCFIYIQVILIGRVVCLLIVAYIYSISFYISCHRRRGKHKNRPIGHTHTLPIIFCSTRCKI